MATVYAFTMIIVRKSTKAVYLLHTGKITLLRPSGWQAQKVPVLTVDEQTWANLVLTHGNPIGS